MRKCRKCGGNLPVHKGRHRPRVYCTTCRPPRLRNKPASVTQLAAGGASLVEATRTKLAALATEPEGLLVLQLAASIEAGGHSGSSLAALSREYGRALASALAGAEEQPAGQVVDGIEWGIG